MAITQAQRRAIQGVVSTFKPGDSESKRQTVIRTIRAFGGNPSEFGFGAKPKPAPKPVYRPAPRPKPKPKPVYRPAPVYRPKPTPKPVYRPAPAPRPAPKPVVKPKPVTQDPSIVNFLNKSGQASDFNSRTKLAQKAGISNYRGTAQQNTQLLNILKQPKPTPKPPTPVQQPVATQPQPQPTPTQTPPQQIPQDLLNFNQAIVNKDYGALNAMGASKPQPADVTSLLDKQGSSITPASITPPPKSNFQTTPPPADVAVPPTPKPPAPMSEVDKRLQAESDSALKASNDITGRSAYQAEQDIAAGVPEQEKLISELSTRIQNLDNQATGAKLKAEDRLAPQFAIGGEQATIERSRAIQALTLKSQLSAAQGNLQNAIDLSDRAVEAKFGPLEAKLNTSLRNLEIIRNSPKFTASQKKKAEATAINKAEELAQVAKAKADAKQVSDFTAQIIAKNPTIDALTVEALSRSKNIVQASQIASARGLIGEQGGANLTFIKGTKTQPAGIFNKDTGVFTPTRGAAGIPTPTIDLSPEDDRNLTGAGLTPTDIQNIKSDVAKFGIDAVLEGIPDQTQKNAIRKVYGVVEPTKSVTEQISSFLNKAKDAGLSRKEANAKIKAQLEKKFGTLTRARKNEIEDELVKVFGRTFWQGILPGGR